MFKTFLERNSVFWVLLAGIDAIFLKWLNSILRASETLSVNFHFQVVKGKSPSKNLLYRDECIRLAIFSSSVKKFSVNLLVRGNGPCYIIKIAALVVLIL